MLVGVIVAVGPGVAVPGVDAGAVGCFRLLQLITISKKIKGIRNITADFFILKPLSRLKLKLVPL